MTRTTTAARRTRRIGSAIRVTLLLLTSAATSAAQEPRPAPAPPPAAATTAESEGYAYRFTDDPLQAGAFTPNDARIAVARRAIRVTLIRPRTAFVSELLRSAERL
ncbi:MAG TPA: hypothetical protein VE987_12130 [Polyangiaceae bacterium]|nr:hypothetical protein [Polyangiaceae bacterium]